MSDLRGEILDLITVLQDNLFSPEVPALVYQVTALMTRFGLPGECEDACIALLTHPHYLVRYEMGIVFRLQHWWLSATGPDRLRFLYALQEFAMLNHLSTSRNQRSTARQARTLLTQACLDPAPQVRRKAGEAWDYTDLTPREEFARTLARGAYFRLPEIVQSLEEPDEAVRHLRLLTAHPLNSNYHQRQAAQALQFTDRANSSADRESVPATTGSTHLHVRRDKASVRNGCLPESPDNPENIYGRQLVDILSRYPIFLQDAEVWPTIHCQTRTGRIAYRNPGVLSFSRQQRRRLLTPPAPYHIVQFDVRMMEPTVLTRILTQEDRLSETAIPTDYVDLGDQERPVMKRIINRFMNGGALPHHEDLTSLGARWCNAVGHWQMHVSQEARLAGAVRTVTGREIPVDSSTPGWERRAFNRIIQGSAADLFHHAVCQLHAVLPEAHRVYLLLYDAVWILWDSRHGECPGDLCAKMLAQFLDPEQLAVFTVNWQRISE